MEKRYQVFVSSTYADLQDERRKVIQALMEMDCIPAGMELFPAADDEQWEFIKRVIDDCDYYILIMGGRYGSLASEGVSYTEREFDYAISKEIKVLAFVHEAPAELSVSKSDIDPELRDKLTRFRDRVCQDRLVKFWAAAAELPGLVALSLQKTIKVYPAIGWVRADSIASTTALTEVNVLTKENTELRARVAHLEVEEAVEDLAALDDDYVTKVYSPDWTGVRDAKISWGGIWGILAPKLDAFPQEKDLRRILGGELWARHGGGGMKGNIIESDIETIRIQFIALGFIEAKYIASQADYWWSISPAGYRAMLQARAIKTRK